MSARYTLTIHQQNWRSNRVTVEVVAANAKEAQVKAFTLAPRIHSPIVTFGPIVEVEDGE